MSVGKLNSMGRGGAPFKPAATAFHWRTVCSAGKWQVKVLPLPTLLSICSWPRWWISTCLTIARPRPVPPVLAARLASTR